MVKKFRTRVARVAQLLNQHQVRYVVIGAEACNVHGVVRGTKDVDILLEKTLPISKCSNKSNNRVKNKR